jgi:hypothetical protein
LDHMAQRITHYTAYMRRRNGNIDLTLDPTTLVGAMTSLFKEQSTYMYKVFSDTLHMSHGRSCISAFGTTQNGQGVYMKICSDKTTWKLEFWCGQKRSVITATKTVAQVWLLV